MVSPVTPPGGTDTDVVLGVGKEIEKNAKSDASDALVMSQFVFECFENPTTGCHGASSQNYGVVTASDVSRHEWVIGRLLLTLDSNTTVYPRWIDIN